MERTLQRKRHQQKFASEQCAQRLAATSQDKERALLVLTCKDKQSCWYIDIRPVNRAPESAATQSAPVPMGAYRPMPSASTLISSAVDRSSPSATRNVWPAADGCRKQHMRKSTRFSGPPCCMHCQAPLPNGSGKRRCTRPSRRAKLPGASLA